MFVKIWGARGSIPVSGQEYIKYGGDTTCIEIRSKNDKIIIIDAGTGIRKLGKALLAQGLCSYDLIFTHAHWDHVMGFPFFRPLYSDRTSLHVHGCPFAEEFVRTMLARMLSPPNFPVNYGDLQARIEYSDGCPDKFQIDSITVVPIDISHPGGGKGYRFVEDGRCFVFLTDHELGHTHAGGRTHEDYLRFCARADLLIHDAEFTGEEPTLAILKHTNPCGVGQGANLLEAWDKAFATDRPTLPAPKSLTGVAYTWGGDEHGILTAAQGSIPLELGDRVEFIVSATEYGSVTRLRTTPTPRAKTSTTYR